MFSVFAPAAARQRAVASVKAEAQKASVAQKKREATQAMQLQQQGRGPLSPPTSASKQSPPAQMEDGPPEEVAAHANGAPSDAAASVSDPATFACGSPAKRQKTSRNLLTVGGSGGGGSGGSNGASSSSAQRVKGEQSGAAASSAAAAVTPFTAPLAPMDWDSSSVSASQQTDAYSLVLSERSDAPPDFDLTVPPTREDLVANGQPVPVAFAPSSPYMLQPQEYVLQPHQNPYVHAASQQRGRSVPHRHGGGRAIRGPHRVPMAHEIHVDEDDEPAYHAAAAASSSTAGGVVDLTQDSNAFMCSPPGSADDVQVISHVYNAFSAAAAAPAPAAYNPFGFDPYLAAYQAATASSKPYPSPPPPPEKEKPISAVQFSELSKEQQAVVLAIRKGESVFFSGCAGTGKSHLLKLLAQFLPKRSTFFTASTGLAAVNIGGSTLHSFAGVGLGEGSAESLGLKARGNKGANGRWNSCRVLVIDEISMISGSFFDKLEEVARIVRRSTEPFGGIQLVLSGDFLQLPPVKATKPTFRASSWEACIKRRIVLTTVFRQKGDPLFISLLANLRVGQLALKEEAALKKSHYNQLPPQHGVIATKLNALKRDTASENDGYLSKIDQVPVFFKAHDTYRSEPHMELLRKNCPAPEILKLKQGAQVMLLRNISPETGLCNGSRGIVIDFVRMQGEEHGGVVEDDAFAGPAAPPKPNDRVGVNETPYWTSEKNHSFGGRLDDATLGNAEQVSLLPRVQFDNGVIQVIESDKWEISVRDEVQACRRQIPLTLAWALTIHKSQGMTLERAEINSQGMFENGQLYVAVSRVKSLKGLKLLNFTRDSMRTDHSVVAWYKQLERETLQSTADLLKEVDKFFPALQQQLEDERVQNREAEAKEQRDLAIHKAGPFAQAAAAAAASGYGSSAAAPILLSPGSPIKKEEPAASGFMRASHMVAGGSGGSAARNGSGVNREAPGGAPFTPKKENPSPVKAEPSESSVKIEQPARPPPQPFRSPLRNPAAAAFSTAVAQSILTGADILISPPAAESAPAPAPAPAAPTPDVGGCCVCRSSVADHAIFECMHLCMCGDCSQRFAPHDGADTPVGVPHRCPICQVPIKKIQRMFTA